MLIEIKSRPGRKIYMTKSEMEARRKRMGMSSVQFYGAIVMDSKLTMPEPNEILFGPNHASLPPDAPASWTPDTHRDYMKRHG